ncbi:hypothetical protein NHQ30_001898 [Ciborinia camelliae]|nr:hypothetical protein NHQ30_001898 [Ciborinia camelliae]
MSPNLRLAAHRLVHPREWKIFKVKKEPSKELIYQTTPVPGIYSIDEMGTGFLVAIQPISGKRDIDKIFEVCPCGNYITASSDHPSSTTNKSSKSPAAEPFIGCRFLRYPPKVQYCKIMDRQVFTGELEKRYVAFEYAKGEVLHLFRLDHPYIYVEIAYEKKGKNGELSNVPKIPRNHKGINGDFWHSTRSINPFRRMGVEEAQKAREEMAKKGRDIWWCEKGDEPYMKVLRYVQSPICLD